MRRGIISALLMACLLAGVAVKVIIDANSAYPGRAVLQSEFMDYCRSDQNTSPDKQAQIKFLGKNELTADRERIDVMVGDRRKGVLFVRYFLSDGESGGITWRCKFGLVGISPDGAAKGYFVRNGQDFQPIPDEFCLSTAPPVISRDRMAATLQCDWLVPSRLEAVS